MTENTGTSDRSAHLFHLDSAFGIEGYNAESYGDAFADVYDQWYDSLDDDDFVDLIASSLPAHPVRILELGVGTGRLLGSLHKRRSPIVDHLVGVDASQAMLDIAERNLGDSATVVRGDFTSSLPEGPFDLIFVGYNTLFNVADQNALCSCLSLVATHLSPTGQFFVDVVTAPQQQSGDHIGIRSMTNTEVVISVSRHDAEAQRIVGQFVQFADGARVRVRPWSIRYFSPLQLDTFAKNCGLSLARRLADGHGNPFTTDSDRHISVYTPTDPS